MRYLLLTLLKLYQWLISPVIGSNCRFYPTCSQYSYDSIARHGAYQGIKLSLKRLSKCHPWHQGGLDPVPQHLKH